MPALAVAAVIAIVWDFTVASFLHRERNRGEVVRRYNNLQIGMTKKEVQHVLDSSSYHHLEFYQTDTSRWSASAPSEFGAGNWVLIIEFLREHVSGLRIRTADSEGHHPVEVPKDETTTRD